jgi:hypothetical protein
MAMAIVSVVGSNFFVSAHVVVTTRNNPNHLFSHHRKATGSAYLVHRHLLDTVDEADQVDDTKEGQEEEEEEEEEEMMVFKQTLPQEINVDPRSTYNQKFMALMNSPCRPETDGFFGATSGDAIRIQYGFELEVEPLSDILILLDVLDDLVVDAILINTFPAECGLRRHRLRTMEGEGPMRYLAKDDNKEKTNESAQVEGHPSGYHFMKFEEVGTFGSKTTNNKQNIHSQKTLF